MLVIRYRHIRVIIILTMLENKAARVCWKAHRDSYRTRDDFSTLWMVLFLCHGVWCGVAKMGLLVRWWGHRYVQYVVLEGHSNAKIRQDAGMQVHASLYNQT